MQFGDRKRFILSAIVNSYIETGEPVGSKLLASITGLSISSATIRNEMSELAEMGFLGQPHTSSGRIPTQMGYRIYVDSLMVTYLLTETERAKIDSLLNIEGADLESLLERSGEMLASLTGCAAVSAAPTDESVRVRRIELVITGRFTLLLVILATSGVIKSRFYRAEEDVSSDMITFFSRLVNEKISGKSLAEITPVLMNKLAEGLYEYTLTLAPLLDIIYEEIKLFNTSEVFLGGETNLLNHPEFDSVRVLSMIRFLEKREELARLIVGVQNGVSVRIGTENGQALMQASSFIVAPVVFMGHPAGAIGIIGPTRMNYAKLISNIEYFSKVLSKIISESFFYE